MVFQERKNKYILETLKCLAVTYEMAVISKTEKRLFKGNLNSNIENNYSLFVNHLLYKTHILRPINKNGFG